MPLRKGRGSGHRCSSYAGIRNKYTKQRRLIKRKCPVWISPLMLNIVSYQWGYQSLEIWREWVLKQLPKYKMWFTFAVRNGAKTLQMLPNKGPWGRSPKNLVNATRHQTTDTACITDWRQFKWQVEDHRNDFFFWKRGTKNSGEQRTWWVKMIEVRWRNSKRVGSPDSEPGL